MCELFAVSLRKKIQVNKYLYILREHSHQHPDGWGMSVFDGSKIKTIKEKCPAHESDLLLRMLSSPLEAKDMIGHIRLATRGVIVEENCHPFTGVDNSGRTWVLAHNGTIFDSKILDAYAEEQIGTTDSERIILHLIHEADRLNDRNNKEVTLQDRLHLMDELVLSIVRPNKLNLMVYDGEVLFIHTNMRDTLFCKSIDEGLVFGTAPLDEERDSWEPLEMMRLFAFKDGRQIFAGTKHDYEYFLEG